jgi:toxin secretion/phage lysis holin
MKHVTISIATGLAAAWANIPALVQALIILTLLDVFSGVGKAIVNRTLSSSMSYRGAVRKSLGFVLVAAGWVAHNKLGIGVPLDQIIAGFFCTSELFSIVENCQSAGVPVPAAIVKYFKTYREEQESGRVKDQGK